MQSWQKQQLYIGVEPETPSRWRRRSRREQKSAGAECTLVSVSEFDESILPSLTGIAFGCPAMGAEVLEEAEFQPLWDSVSGKLGGKKVALFGSYGWGDGEWMRSWEEDCANNGVQLATESVICNDAPDDAALDSCKALGAAIAG
jgi:flavodoxin I